MNQETRVSADRMPDLMEDISEVLISADDIQSKIAQLAKEIDSDYADREVLLVGVLKGACMVMADLARALTSAIVTMDFMAASSHVSPPPSSGVGRILNGPPRRLARRHVLLRPGIVDPRPPLTLLVR